MPKTEILPIDRVRSYWKNYIDFVQNDFSMPVSKATFVSHYFEKTGEPVDAGSLSNLQTMYDTIVCNKIPAFVFTKEIYDPVKESRMGKIPVDLLEMPYEQLLISIPYKELYFDGSDMLWDVVQVSKCETYIIEKNKTEWFWNLSFFNSSDLSSFKWIQFPVNEFESVTDNHFNPPWTRKGIEDVHASKAFRAVIKLILFLNSMSCEKTLVKRPVNPKAPKVIREGFNKYHIIKLKPNTIKYEDSDTNEPSYHLNVRFSVRGHFKYFTKGVMAGRVLWCPPHWKGPETGTQIQKDYQVERF